VQQGNANGGENKNEANLAKDNNKDNNNNTDGKADDAVLFPGGNQNGDHKSDQIAGGNFNPVQLPGGKDQIGAAKTGDADKQKDDAHSFDGANDGLGGPGGNANIILISSFDGANDGLGGPGGNLRKS
jgi:hypothetical protein